LAEYKVRVNGSSFLYYCVKLLKILTKSFKALKVLLSLPPGLLGVGQGAASLHWKIATAPFDGIVSS
jgi:hypothetical protein